MRDDKTSHDLVRSILGAMLAACWLAGTSASAQERRGQEPGEHSKTAELARATELDAQAGRLFEQGRYEEAMPLVREILALRERILGGTHPDVAESLDNLALLHHTKGEYDKALPLYERALSIREKALGQNHPDVANTLNNLGGLYGSLGEFDRALPLHERALAIREKVLGSEHPDLAFSLDNLATLHSRLGAYDRALPLHERALAIREKALDPEHPDLAYSLTNLAALHQAMGKHDKALPLHERALAIREKVLGPDHALVAISLTLLAALHGKRGEYSKALPLFERALAIQETALGQNHPDVAIASSNLAGLYDYLGNHDRALPLYERALAIQENALGPEHPDVASSLNNLAILYYRRGEYEEALPLYERALAIQENALGHEHPEVAIFLNNLAVLHHAMGEHDKAQPLYERALTIEEKALGPEHPDVTIGMNNLASLHAARGRIQTAIELFERSSRIRARILGQWLHGGSEHQRYRRMASFLRNVYTRVPFHLSRAAKNPRAAHLAMESILSYKSRILDVMADTLRAAYLDADPHTRTMLDQLRNAQAALSHLYLQSSGGDQTSQARYRQRRADLESRIDELQARLSARSETYRRIAEPVTIAALHNHLPHDTVLLEFFVYRPFAFEATGPAALKRYGEPRYAAYTVQPDGQVHGLDLGPAEVIDEAVARLRDSFARYGTDANDRARELDALVMQPVREHLGDAARVYLSPAGQLGFVPFAALVDERGRYLVERYSFTYLASGRDLMQRPRSTEAPAREAQPVTIVAAPSYGLSPVADALANTSAAEVLDTASKHHRSRDATQIGQVEALSGTRREAEILGALWPHSVVWTEVAATETAVKSVQSPRILHLATHGFFLADQDLEIMDALSSDDMSLPSGIYGRLGVRGHRAPVENGLLRSGLLLAGANELRDPAGDNDGVLTALEVSAMNLAGTRLVVLSACDTGIGANGPDQGVYGLRRAFAIAGAQTLVMSLWKVDDNATQDLMARYYRYLLAGEGRAEAMRRVQLDYLAQGGQRMHPHFWASFVVSGDDSTLAGEPPRLATVRAGGCAGCSTGDGGAGAPWLHALIMLMLVFVISNRVSRAARELRRHRRSHAE